MSPRCSSPGRRRGGGAAARCAEEGPQPSLPPGMQSLHWARVVLAGMLERLVGAPGRGFALGALAAGLTAVAAAASRSLDGAGPWDDAPLAAQVTRLALAQALLLEGDVARGVAAVEGLLAWMEDEAVPERRTAIMLLPFSQLQSLAAVLRGAGACEAVAWRIERLIRPMCDLYHALDVVHPVWQSFVLCALVAVARGTGARVRAPPFADVEGLWPGVRGRVLGPSAEDAFADAVDAALRERSAPAPVAAGSAGGARGVPRVLAGAARDERMAARVLLQLGQPTVT
mmetsp:Transcript_8634/g.29443  ORF Transcript_8634/g.29443 Transcript_8634/m.29443 type:complete len:286 (+) Transcript_8634:128-985(+)